MKTYDDLMQVIPNDPKLYYNRGLVFAAAQQFDKALAEYEHAILLNPSYTEPLLNRGVVYTDNLNQYDKGIADFNAVLALQPNNIDAMVNIGVALYKKGDPTSAIKQYNKALSLNPNNARVYYLRALSDAALQKYNDAVNDAKQAGSMGITIDQAVVNSWQAAAAKK